MLFPPTSLSYVQTPASRHLAALLLPDGFPRDTECGWKLRGHSSLTVMWLFEHVPACRHMVADHTGGPKRTHTGLMYTCKHACMYAHRCDILYASVAARGEKVLTGLAGRLEWFTVSLILTCRINRSASCKTINSSHVVEIQKYTQTFYWFVRTKFFKHISSV